jgi:hypothetical protein
MSFGKYHLSPAAQGEVAVRDLEGIAARAGEGDPVAPLLPETPADAATLIDRIRALLARPHTSATP